MKEEIKNLNISAVYPRFCTIYKTMLSYCSKLQEFTGTKNQKFQREIKEGKCFVKMCKCDSQTLRFFNEQEASELLFSSLLGIEIPL